MCRMIVGAGHVSIDYLIDGLQTMAQKGHTDGWGSAHRVGNRLEVRRSTSSCISDIGLEAYSSVETDLAVFHARRSPPNGVVNASVTHPFFLPPDYHVFHNTWFNSGECDPRRLVAHLRRYLKPGEEEASLLEAMAGLKDFTAANCVVVSPRKAVVASRFDQNSRKAPYYQMVYSPAHDSVVVSSETLLERSWLSLPNGSVMAVYPDGKFELYKP